ncbi:MAG: phage Gp37/Gp68 family protein [Cytophagaceae bacterium]|nr:phage Gp37/Gp68 family protein [Cytophagaceae bacterium]
MPVQKKRSGEYRIPSGTLVYTCFTSDFFVEDADEWRAEAWAMMRLRSDLHFMMITKRIDRLHETKPNDWGDGYDNVTICCTIENQDRANYRLPIYKTAPIKHKILICEPLIERIDLRCYNIGSWAEQVVAGGESGYYARPCNFDWIMELRNLCVENNVSFWFKQTGAKFIKDGRLYNIKRQFQHSQAKRAGINL